MRSKKELESLLLNHKRKNDYQWKIIYISMFLDIRGVNDTLILTNYSRSIREKLEFDSIIVKSSSSYRASQIRVYQYSAQAGSRV